MIVFFEQVIIDYKFITSHNFERLIGKMAQYYVHFLDPTPHGSHF
jgi:hypothetical protein